MEDDEQQLRLQQRKQRKFLGSEVSRLEGEIKKTFSLWCGGDALTGRRLLEQELEAVLFEKAELEETERIQAIIKKAVDTKLVQSPRLLRNIGTCPLCHEEPKERLCGLENQGGRFWCCGAKCCYECFHKHTHDYFMTSIDVETRFQQHQKEYYIEMKKLEEKSLCPLCSGHFINEQGTYSPMLLRRAEAGEVWAMTELGHSFACGKGVSVDLSKSAKWYKKAADQGDVITMLCYGRYLRKKVPGALKKGEAFILRAARRGQANAQQEMFGIRSAEGHEDAIVWLSLAAAQEYGSAVLGMGKMCEEGVAGVRQSDHAAIFWYRKSTRSGYAENMNPIELRTMPSLANCLLRAKAKVFGAPNIVGHSAAPEAHFWFNAVVGSPDPHTDLSYWRRYSATDTACGCCGKKASAKVAIKQCTKCKAIGYCSKECQARHWTLGHDIDCMVVNNVRLDREEMKKRPIQTRVQFL
jgi:MYND finger/Sel1 repeat